MDGIKYRFTNDASNSDPGAVLLRFQICSKTQYKKWNKRQYKKITGLIKS